MKPEISIILPVYNVEKYISKCIQSVLDQTYPNFELLVVIDGSPDNSKQIAASFVDDRITIYEKENGGLSDARNYGLERANGEYVYFMDSDDWIEPNLLEVCVSRIEKYKTDFIIFGYHLDRENLNGNIISTTKIAHNEIVYSKEIKNLCFEDNTLGLLGYAWNKFYKFSFLNENKLKFEKGISLVEDILFNAKVCELSSKIVFVNQTLYHYIDRPVTTLIKKFHKDSFELKIKKSRALKTFLTTWEVDETKRNNILSESIVSGIRYCVNNLFAFKNELSTKDKIAYLKIMLSHVETKKYISYFEAKTINDKIYKYLIANEAAISLFILSKLKK